MVLRKIPGGLGSTEALGLVVSRLILILLGYPGDLVGSLNTGSCAAYYGFEWELIGDTSWTC